MIIGESTPEQASGLRKQVSGLRSQASGHRLQVIAGTEVAKERF